MENEEARKMVDKINGNLMNKYIRYLILDFYEREAWIPLGYRSFRECARDVFVKNDRYIYYHLAAAQAEKNICANTPDVELPIPEFQLRPLIKLKNNPNQQRKAWELAVERAKGKVTMRDVASAVKEVEPKQQGWTGQVEKPSILGYAVIFAKTAICHLERITPDDPKRAEAFELVKKWIRKHNKKTQNGGLKNGKNKS